MTVGDFREKNPSKGKNPSKVWQTSIEVSKREILTNGYYNKKMANVGENGKFRQK